jgi:hypothetical protein
MKICAATCIYVHVYTTHTRGQQTLGARLYICTSTRCIIITLQSELGYLYVRKTHTIYDGWTLHGIHHTDERRKRLSLSRVGVYLSAGVFICRDDECDVRWRRGVECTYTQDTLENHVYGWGDTNKKIMRMKSLMLYCSLSNFITIALAAGPFLRPARWRGMRKCRDHLIKCVYPWKIAPPGHVLSAWCAVLSACTARACKSQTCGYVILIVALCTWYTPCSLCGGAIEVW